MANRVFLVLSEADDPNVQYDEDQIVLTASYMLPVFWCMSCSTEDIRWRLLGDDDAGDVEVGGDADEDEEVFYPILLTSLDTAKRRARERRVRFFRLFPRRLDPVYDEWLALLDGFDAPYLLVDTYELWAMGEPGDFETMLIECVSAFENDDPRYWSVLLSQASIEFDTTTGQLSFDEKIIPVLLHGYDWLRPVPWSDDDDEV